jgi:photosynthetic reaction center cytochrome c subunit
MRKILLMVAVAMLAALAMFAQDKGGPPKGGKGKGGPPKNLKILTPENYMDNMRSFVPALGLADKGGCNFCHVADDRSSDMKQEKVMARMMIGMVNDINGKFPDGKVHVTCFTCHRGSTEPLTAPPAAN